MEEIKIGRPTIGITKKVSITLPEEYWDMLDVLQEESGASSRSELLRKILVTVLLDDKKKSNHDLEDCCLTCKRLNIVQSFDNATVCFNGCDTSRVVVEPTMAACQNYKKATRQEIDVVESCYGIRLYTVNRSLSDLPKGNHKVNDYLDEYPDEAWD